MNDEEVREAVEYYQNSIALGNQGHIKTLVTLAQLYLAIAGMEGMPKEKTKIQDNRNYEYWEDKGFNLARQECILALRIFFPNNTTLTRD